MRLLINTYKTWLVATNYITKSSIATKDLKRRYRESMTISFILKDLHYIERVYEIKNSIQKITNNIFLEKFTKIVVKV